MELCSKGTASVQLKQPGASGIYPDCLNWIPAITPAGDYVRLEALALSAACVRIKIVHSMKSFYFIEVRVAKNCRPATEILPSMSSEHSSQFTGNCVVICRLRASKLRDPINKKCV